jgi:2-C-methyl-D-erythritol 4-phosphate cytidylyltransferase
LDVILGGAGRTDTDARCVVETIDREDLVEVQTPQVFQLGLLRRAYGRISGGQIDGIGITDDASLVEQFGGQVRVVEGESTNVKITRPEDLKLAEALATMGERDKVASLGPKRLFGADDEE